MAGDPITDVAKAVIDAWNASAAITASVPGGLREGPLDAPRGETFYATLAVQQGPRANEYGSQGDWIDYEVVTITLYGVGFKAVGDVVAVIKAHLETSTLSIANASFMRWECLPGWTNERDDKKDGQDYRKAVMKWAVWSYRSG